MEGQADGAGADVGCARWGPCSHAFFSVHHTSRTNCDSVILNMALPSVVETIPPFNVSIKDPEHGQSLKEVVVPLGGGRSILCEANKNSSQIYWSSRGELVPLQRQLLGENGTLSDSPSLQNVVAVEVSNTQELLVFRQAVESNAGVFDCNTESEEGESASTFVEVIVMNGKCNNIVYCISWESTCVTLGQTLHS